MFAVLLVLPGRIALGGWTNGAWFPAVAGGSRAMVFAGFWMVRCLRGGRVGWRIHGGRVFRTRGGGWWLITGGLWLMLMRRGICLPRWMLCGPS